MQRSTGITLLVGSAVYLAGAFLPVSQRVFSALDDPGTMASAIADNESAWTTASALFAIGVLVAGAGLLMLARQATAESDATTIRTVGFVGALAAVVGALAFAFTSADSWHT